ncbi:pyridoxal 5'-phosphate synthase lyase subunit PdxS [Haloferax mediterranei ATCC 33500]|uniref:Pyridoxal 5'-phosphate synthase subunit PdxS n=1 Tax=Haloferax mediterranei (strain ATCC 33500 / DSM 1411 / JCM 8866 / NBRC 14739 / NCIMB 2177 / R-4) TaxID=523841 RepID=I3R722_HALMT|nr:pyridoxal 5'-phosphate synthase lyase subunit PdxS [Haloferax mediterranei]AFK20032.1 pyridoxal biosynthesis lyase PdxS [Haloferax mediterranei ATCC 33500]AHZ23408.1 pyridoxal biosynthesis protein [Haloferax mediterranei ATCC 33500]ELZ99578.1 pyridoxal biosynthesis lyase PdxS [Haloferax mediterranei ATCC 33500]MDX5987218.1 pyridoxal 5'-phosphate synthase lyase subunit PdxS [Haloferax mediterranei ATCC 33500]QCQ76523.1 pyridoxal 5'-phosphate synthase lyase subunit PdxS [Haloferax mediterrane
MAEETDLEELRRGTELVKRGFAQMQKGGVIMDVVNAEQAKIAEEAGAVAVMALEAVPADIRKRGGVSRMADPEKVKEIIDAVSIPVMGKARIGHYTEAQILEAIGVDMVDESEVLTPADNEYHIDKREFTSPFVCGARNLPEALRRINEGAAMIRTKGEAGTGDVNQAVTHQRTIKNQIRTLTGLNFDEREKWAREHEAPADLVHETAEMGRLPVVNFAAGGIATPADAALMMYHECDGIFVGSGIFGAEDPETMGEAVVEAVNNWDDPEKLADIASGIGKGMKGEANVDMPEEKKLQGRGV